MKLSNVLDKVFLFLTNIYCNHFCLHGIKTRNIKENIVCTLDINQKCKIFDLQYKIVIKDYL